MLLAACSLLLGACGEERSRPPQAALVARVIDGDTLELAGGVKVRVLGIDAPEMERDGQPADFLAHKAKAVLNELTLNRMISLEYDQVRYDHYGRLLAYLRLPDRTLLNAELARRGLGPGLFHCSQPALPGGPAGGPTGGHRGPAGGVAETAQAG